MHGKFCSAIGSGTLKLSGDVRTVFGFFAGGVVLEASVSVLFLVAFEHVLDELGA